MAAVRASPKQRDRTLRVLGSAYRDGLLSTGTFELRIDAALRVRTTKQLRALLADLPGSARLREVIEGALRRSMATELPTAAKINLVLPSHAAPSRLSVGRHQGCDVVFTDTTVSRYHALLRREGTSWLLYDFGSRNGTWINGERVERKAVTPGDEVAFGSFVVRLV